MASPSSPAPNTELEGLSMTLAEVEAAFWKGKEEDKASMDFFESNGITHTADYFEHACDKFSKNACLVSVETGETLTYRDVDLKANQVAHWAHSTGVVKPGHVVCLLMENRIEFVWLWLGLSKVGATISLLNTSIEGELLHHAIHLAVGGGGVCVCSQDQVNKIRDMYTHTHTQTHTHTHTPELKKLELQTYVYNDSEDFAVLPNEHLLKPLIAHQPDTRPDKKIRDGLGTYNAHFYIYTSGTTGRSKAARFNHKRVIGAGVTWARHMKLTDKDVYYCTLPLYHGNGGVVAVSACWKSGCSLVIRKKFSASNFFADIRMYKCTATIYVGELWRYVCVLPPKDDDGVHTLRVAAGNGLRPDTWRQVVNRFKVQHLVEHYGQTEMPAAHPMINSYNRVASCGYIPPHVRGSLGTEKLVRFDVENDRVYRNKEGFCEAAVPDANGDVQGEAIVRLEEYYSGYTTHESTEKVLYRDVFEKGDLWYHSGDILRCDKHGFFYFVDRAGDTYRCKGENVSTHEVCALLSECPVVCEANVYGIPVPGDDTYGKIGMASILPMSGVSTDNFLIKFREHCHETLPHYARPAFVRVRSTENEKTGTFKFQKYRYTKEGCNPTLVEAAGDALYMDSVKEKKYMRVDEKVYKDILAGVYRL